MSNIENIKKHQSGVFCVDCLGVNEKACNLFYIFSDKKNKKELTLVCKRCNTSRVIVVVDGGR